jgi:hypothetical protein
MAIAKLLLREIPFGNGYQLATLNISNNKIENNGVYYIFEALSDVRCHLKHLNLTKISITYTNGVTVVPVMQL